MLDFVANWLVILIVAAAAVYAGAAVWGSLTVLRSNMVTHEYTDRLNRMPALAALQAAEAHLAEKRIELSDVEARLQSILADENEARRNAADAQHWQTLAQSAEQAYRDLEDKIAAVEAVKDQADEAKADLAEIQNYRDDLLRQRDALERQVRDLEAQKVETEDMSARLSELEAQIKDSRKTLEDLNDVREDRERARIALDRLDREKADLEKALETLPTKIASLELHHEQLSEQVADLKDKQEERRVVEDNIGHLNARAEALRTEIEALTGERDTAAGIRPAPGTDPSLTDAEAAEAIADLWTPPSCLFKSTEAIFTTPRHHISEDEAISTVEVYLKDLGLRFDSELIKQFHTSIKISRVSPLTVLAGISGTGKSLLPQRYAEAIGMPFLKVAVQPRWDSPQDLLGFYNYLEKQYKATDLARAMAYMDPMQTNSSEGAIDNPMDNRVLMVLLDEMNLARIEYYFSEFLSRLENRPGPGKETDANTRASRIEVDVPASGGKSVSIYPGHNTLFVGTMNEDESTQTLSDKVLDRGNAIRFGQPEQFVDHRDADGAGRAIEPDAYLPFDTWTSWFNERLSEDRHESLITQVQRLNNALTDLQRPFGHRIFHAISAYAANHPDTDQADSDELRLCEMTRMRVLPKLRGVDLQDGGETAINKLASIVDEWGDSNLAVKIRSSIGDDGMFTWRG